MENLLDTELVKRAQQGEGPAFDELVARYQKKVTHLVYRYVNDADVALDLVQDIFFKIFRNLVNFKGQSKFSSWLFRIAVNDCVDHLRRLKVRKEHSLDHIREYGFDVPDLHHSSDVEGQIVDAETQQRIRAVLNSLPENQRTVVVMKIYQDMKFDEIAEILGDPVSTVKSRLYKAFNNLGGLLRRQTFIEGGKSS